MIDAAALLTMANMVRENVIQDSRDFFMVIFRQFRTDLIIVIGNSTYRSGAGWGGAIVGNTYFHCHGMTVAAERYRSFQCSVVIGHQVNPEQDHYPQHHAAGGPGAGQDSLWSVVQEQRAKKVPEVSEKAAA